MESTFAPLKRSRVVALSDGDLMRRVGRADPVAFEVFCDRHRVAAFCLAVRTCRSRVAAEDVMQEALLALWREAPRFDPARGTPRSWVLAMVHHRAIDAVRKLGVHERRWAG